MSVSSGRPDERLARAVLAVCFTMQAEFAPIIFKHRAGEFNE